MSLKQKTVETVKERPQKAFLAALLLLVWLLVPPMAQYFYDYSAIKSSFAITVTYFVFWKGYELAGKYLDLGSKAE
ncbi:MAG: hypothetical protein ABEJ93_01250 [Candidatus Nanohalobium sp.]